MGPSDIDEGERRAALALLGLGQVDRSWLLTRLPDAQRDRVASLLRELERMNLPPDPLALMPPGSADDPASAADAEEIPAAIVQTVEREEPVPSSVANAARARLAQADPAAIHRALRDEPDAVVARVLALEDWPWAAALAGLLGKPRAGRIDRLRHDGPTLPGTVAQVLVDALLARIGTSGLRGASFADEMQAAEEDQRRKGRRWMRWFR